MCNPSCCFYLLFLQNNIYYRQVSAYTGEVLNAACFNTNSFRDYFTNLCLKLAKNTEIDGFLYGRDNDWVFVDWNVDLDTSGALCFEQILLFLALENFSRIGEALGKDAAVYKIAARKLKRRIDEVFWNEKRGVYMHSIKDGKLSENVTAYANMFAVLYGFADQKKRAKIVRALLNDKDIPAVNTPYMQTYKLSCLFELGEYDGIQNDVEFGEKFVAKPVLNLVKNASITVAMKRGKLTLKVKEDEIEVFSTDIEGTLFAFGREFSVPAGKKITCKEKV